MFFKAHNLVFRFFCGNVDTKVEYRYVQEHCNWMPCNDFPVDHHAVAMGAEMLAHIYNPMSSVTPKALEYDYDSVLLRLTVEEVMDERTAIYTMHEAYGSLGWRMSDIEVYKGHGMLVPFRLEDEVVLYQTAVDRAACHLGRTLTHEEVINYIKKDQEVN